MECLPVNYDMFDNAGAVMECPPVIYDMFDIAEAVMECPQVNMICLILQKL